MEIRHGPNVLIDYKEISYSRDYPLGYVFVNWAFTTDREGTF